MPILDLGGAPAREPCAQVGITTDFGRLNRLELETYEAALIARFGAPPAGCRFEQVDHHHDFGCYLTLALRFDDPGSQAAHRYADAVETGIGTWLEAGFTAPVTYHDAQAIRVRSLDVTVLGALQVTRPDAHGRFPLAEFATLHANLAAAFPRLAGRHRRRLLGEAA